MYSGLTANLAELEARVTQRIHNVTPEIPRSIFEHALYRFQLMADSIWNLTAAYLVIIKHRIVLYFLRGFWPKVN